MHKVSDIFTNIDRTLERRKQIASKFETAFREAPEEMNELILTIGKLYYSGKIPRFWDVLAALSGCERGYGNDNFFTALEIQKEIKK